MSVENENDPQPPVAPRTLTWTPEVVADPVGVLEDEPVPVRTDVTPMPARDEHERLDPQPLVLTLESGTVFDLEPLKLRQFLRLLRIVTRGAADILDSTQLDFENPEQFVQTFLGMVLFSIPEAEEETIDFLKSMVRPANLTGDPAKDIISVRALSAELENPELEDTLTIVQAVIERESEDLRALGKRLMTMFATAEKLGATKQKQPSGN